MPMSRRLPILFAALVLVVLPAGAARAAAPEEICQIGRYKAAGKYALCEQKVLGKFAATVDGSGMNAKLSKCRVKYTAVWAKLQAKTAGSGSTCDAPRFVDNGDGTVTDHLTGLQWEQKDAACLDNHCVDNLYRWSLTLPQADGALFTTFVSLVADACFASQCDWRLPTVLELQTILLEPYPCVTIPCIDPIFGATGGASYWSGTTFLSPPLFAFDVGFGDGTVSVDLDDTQLRARVVRGSL